MKAEPDSRYEEEYWRCGALVAGVDEVGRGPLAGPVIAVALVLPRYVRIPDLNDSKLLTPLKRAELACVIEEKALAIGIGRRDVEHIDEHNILQSSVHAMHEALGHVGTTIAHALVDGNYFRHGSIPFTTIVKGDSISISIAAASIIAKVHRDRWMIEHADVLYPQYGFAAHKGYGTRKHREAILAHGPCPLHRRTFLKKILESGPHALSSQ